MDNNTLLTRMSDDTLENNECNKRQRPLKSIQTLNEIKLENMLKSLADISKINYFTISPEGNKVYFPCHYLFTYMEIFVINKVFLHI